MTPRGRMRKLSRLLFSTGLPITAVMVPVYGLFVQLGGAFALGGAIKG